MGNLLYESCADMQSAANDMGVWRKDSEWLVRSAKGDARTAAIKMQRKFLEQVTARLTSGFEKAIKSLWLGSHPTIHNLLDLWQKEHEGKPVDLMANVDRRRMVGSMWAAEFPTVPEFLQNTPSLNQYTPARYGYADIDYQDLYGAENPFWNTMYIGRNGTLAGVGVLFVLWARIMEEARKVHGDENCYVADHNGYFVGGSVVKAVVDRISRDGERGVNAQSIWPEKHRN